MTTSTKFGVMVENLPEEGLDTWEPKKDGKF